MRRRHRGPSACKRSSQARSRRHPPLHPEGTRGGPDLLTRRTATSLTDPLLAPHVERTTARNGEGGSEGGESELRVEEWGLARSPSRSRPTRRDSSPRKPSVQRFGRDAPTTRGLANNRGCRQGLGMAGPEPRCALGSRGRGTGHRGRVPGVDRAPSWLGGVHRTSPRSTLAPTLEALLRAGAWSRGALDAL